MRVENVPPLAAKSWWKRISILRKVILCLSGHSGVWLRTHDYQEREEAMESLLLWWWALRTMCQQWRVFGRIATQVLTRQQPNLSTPPFPCFACGVQTGPLHLRAALCVVISHSRGIKVILLDQAWTSTFLIIYTTISLYYSRCITETTIFLAPFLLSSQSSFRN